MKKVKIIACGMVLGLLMVAGFVLAQTAPGAVVQGDLSVGHGQVNWTERTIVATGSGAPNLNDEKAKQNVAVARLGAERVAKMDALRNILETLKGVQVNSEITVEKEIITNEKMKAKVEGLARNFKVLNIKYYSDGGVDVVVQMSLDGPLASTLVTPPEKPNSVAAVGEPKNSGLVVDARGFKLIPALSPKIVDETGKVLYSADFLDKSSIEGIGVVSYFKDIDSAKSAKRVSSNPLVLKAMRVFENGKSDVVISNADAEKLRDAGSNLKYLSEGKVIIVLD
jgi:hypothetical protein